MNTGKLDIVLSETEHLNLDIFGISELRWIGVGHFSSKNNTVYYSGHPSNRRNGVAIMWSTNCQISLRL